MFTPDPLGRRPAQQRSPFETLVDPRSIVASTRRGHVEPADADVVARRMRVPLVCVGEALEDVPPRIGALEFDRPFGATGGATVPGWRTTGRIHGEGWRISRWTRVDIECNGWTRDSIEIRIRPVTRRVVLWGRRRQRRYFELAHRSVDELVRCVALLVREQEVAPVLDLVRGPVAEDASDASDASSRGPAGAAPIGTGTVRS